MHVLQLVGGRCQHVEPSRAGRGKRGKACITFPDFAQRDNVGLAHFFKSTGLGWQIGCQRAAMDVWIRARTV